MINRTKIFLFVFSLTSLFGCATGRQYDPVEYNYSIISSVAATRAIHQCNDRENVLFKRYVTDLNDATMHLQEYQKFAKNNTQTYQGALELRKLVLGFVLNSNYTEQYCVHKLSGIQSASRVMAKTFGKQGGIDICVSDVSSRYNLYRESYVNNRITQMEFYDLVDDLIKLSNLDSVGCTAQQKNEIQEIINTISKVYSVAGIL